jgi:hypothetical protein
VYDTPTSLLGTTSFEFRKLDKPITVGVYQHGLRSHQIRTTMLFTLYEIPWKNKKTEGGLANDTHVFNYPLQKQGVCNTGNTGYELTIHRCTLCKKSGCKAVYAECRLVRNLSCRQRIVLLSLPALTTV